MAKKKIRMFAKPRNKVKGNAKLNPFEVHINRSKHTILGQKSKDDHGLPGVSRGKAYNKREKTLFHEYRDRFKNSKFLDKRIGENNPFMDPEKKMMLRMVAQKKKQLSKKSIFNLNNDDMLMHGGQALNEITMKDKNAFSDDDDDDDDAFLDSNFVKEQHFGGDIFNKPKDIQDPKTNTGTKSRKEWIDDMIAESKKKKAESKMVKEIHHDAVAKLNEKFQEFVASMKGRGMTDEEKENSKKTCEYNDYDTLVRKLLFDRSKRANPSDRMKSNEEITKEEQERLQKLEEERKRRMLGEEDQKAGSYGRSADALDDEWAYEKKEPTRAKEKSFNNQQINEIKPIEVPDVPTEYDGFWDLLESRSPSEVSSLIEQMIARNHPSLGSDNKSRVNIVLSYLFQSLHNICSADPEVIRDDTHSLCYIDSMIPHLYTLTQLNSNDCAASITEVIDEKYEDYTSQRPRRYPYVDTFIFLKISGLLFPASDFHHDVMTRVITFLAQLLGEAKIQHGRDIVCLLFTASLLTEYVSESRRFVGEIINALNGILYLSIPKNCGKETLPLNPPFKRIGPTSDIMALSKSCQSYNPPNLTLALLNQNVDFDSNLKIKLFSETLLLFKKLCNLWEKLPSVRAVFYPTSKLIERIPREYYPEEIVTLIRSVKADISNLPKQVPHLKRQETTVKTLKMIEPTIEDVFEGYKKRGGSKEFQEKQKLLHKIKRERKGAKRELKRDAQFIARQQLKEVLESDAERKRKVNLIMQGLATQEHDFKKYKSKK